MNKYFYSHLISFESLTAELESLKLSKKEKQELSEIVHLHTHEIIIDTILSHLEEKDKKRFLELLAEGKDDEIWQHLNNKVEKIEEKITAAAQQIKKELKEDIKSMK